MSTHRCRVYISALFSGLLTGLVLTGCRPARADVDVIGSAATALGGADRIRSVKTLILDAEGAEYQLLQNPSPNSITDGPRWVLNPHRRAFDLTNGHMHLRRTIAVTFPWVLPRVRHQDTGIDPNGVYVVDIDGNLRITPGGELALGQDRYHYPLTILAAALRQGATVKNARQLEGFSAVDITVPTGEMLTLAIDNTTHLPAFVSSMRDQPNLGDVEFRTTFSDYQDVKGLKLPRRLITRLDRYVTTELLVTKHAFNEDPDNFLRMPDAGLRASQIPPDPRLAPFTPTEIAPGMWFLRGGCTVGCDNSILVEFSDHLELLEAPVSDARTLLVIAAARNVKPGKPLTKVTLTHHHSDHAGGLRAAISEGLTIVAHESVKSLFEELASRPHTIRPDSLTKKPMPLHLETVGDHLTVNDPMRSMEIFHVDGDPHADSMIMFYFPKEQILVEGDPYNPSNPTHIWAPNLYENIKRLKLVVAKYVPIHGEPVTNAEFLKAVQSGRAALANWYDGHGWDR